MNITEDAKLTLVQLIKEQDANGIRVHSVGGGCCGPQIGLSLHDAQDSDVVQEIDDIKVAIDQEIKSMVEGITLDKQDEQFVLLGLDSCC